MVVPLEYPQRIVLLQIQLLISLLLVIHKRNPRKTCRQDAERQNRRGFWWRGRRRGSWCTTRSRRRLRNRCRHGDLRFKQASGRYPTLFRWILLHLAGSCRVALDHPPASCTGDDDEGIATGPKSTQNQLRTSDKSRTLPHRTRPPAPPYTDISQLNTILPWPEASP